MNINSVQSTEKADTPARVANTPPVRLLDPSETTFGDRDKQTQESLETKEAKEMVEALNDYMDDLQTNLGFSIREDLQNQVVVEIKNRKTKELVRQIPSEELLTIMENMKELTGIIFDQSV